MRILKLFILFAAVSVMSSCLKSKNDFAGLRTDTDGSIVASIAETEYIDQDNNVIGFGYAPFANFDFSGADESVRFFSVHIAQARNKKIKGTLKLNVTASTGSGDPLPAGALTVPATIEIPAFDGVAKDFPVFFTVHKANLDPDAYYSVVFTITGADQAVVSANASEVEVFLYPGKYFGRYMVETTVKDPLNVLKIDQNTKPVLLDNLNFIMGPDWRLGGIPDPGQNFLSLADEYYLGLSGSTGGLAILVNNLSSGTSAGTTAFLYPTYQLDASGKVIAIFDTRNGAQIPVTFTNDLSNQMVINNNGDRTMQVSYNVTLNAPGPGGAAQSRVFNIQQKFTYHEIQVRVFY